MTPEWKTQPSQFSEQKQVQLRLDKRRSRQSVDLALEQVQRQGAIVIHTSTDEIIVVPDLGNVAFNPDARARALLRGREIAEQDMVDAGGAYTLDEVRTLMNGVTRQAVEKRVREGSLLAMTGGSNRRRYPTAQFDSDGNLIRGIKDVHQALPSRNPWFVLNFLVNPDARLELRRPIDMLKEGKVQAVVAAARLVGEQGA